VQAHNWTRVAFIHIILVEPGFGTSAVVSVGLVDVALLRSDPECSGFVVGEVEGCDSHFGCFVVTCVHEFEGVLRNNVDKDNCLKISDKVVAYLRLCKHIHQPTTDRAIRAACY